MSADNGVYILLTKDTHKKIGDNTWQKTFGKGVLAFRVAHAQAIDNLEWYEREQPYNVGYYLNSVFGDSVVYYDIAAAESAANKIARELPILEYGVQLIERRQYSFPGL